MILVSRASKYMVGKDTYSLGVYHICGLTSLQFLPFNFPHFSFISLLLTGLPFFDFVVLWGSSAPIMFISYSWVYSLYMDIISLLTCPFYPFLGYHLRECCIYSYILHIMNEFLFFFFDTDELVSILLSTKFYLKDLKIFPYLWPSVSYSVVLASLSLYIARFYCILVCVYWCILVTCVSLVFFLFWLFPVFIFLSVVSYLTVMPSCSFNA